ncbi:MAG: glycosyltransferase family 2 protein [Verrucomicrobia bacterium]|nr:glycosyltransferase family 2 protein [Verrucomicrobiota bacterium]MBV9658350.1 glycosyltransferase family 2 protein [Verrucomicrobiota bacterium]
MEVSFLIPLFNCLPLTRACLESLEKTVPRRLAWEALLIDDGSTDGTREFLATLPAPRYRVLLNDPPRQGYARNNNAAARLARGDVLCLLNNDTVLLAGWLEPMLRALRRAPRVCLVGNIQREPVSGLIDHAGVVFNGRGNPIHFGKDLAVPPDTTPWTRRPAVTAACCVVKKELFLALGGFDEGYENGFEDIDFCLRAGERGWRHYVANDSVIYHHISSAPGRHARERANLRRYRARWGRRILAWKRRRRWHRRRILRRHTAGLVARGLLPAEDALPQLNGPAVARWLEERQERHSIIEQQRDGRRYLRKHLFRPWRYNFTRLCRALEHACQPDPPPAFSASSENAVDDFFAPWEAARPMPGGLVVFHPVGL